LLRPLGITRIANVTGLDVLGVPVVVVCRPNARSLSVSQGKGPTLEAAKASGVMESIELFHAERPVLPLRLSSYRDLKLAETVVNVESLHRPEAGLYHDHLRMLWVEGFDILRQEHVWVPYEIVHMDCTVPMPPGSGSFFLNSNGLASGNHLLEALSQAICEVIERDSHARWHRSDSTAQRQTMVDPSTVNAPASMAILSSFAEAGFGVSIWHITSPIGVPAFRAEIWERDPRETGVMGSSAGMGCHPSRDIALLRALTEAAQTRVTWISGARDDLFRRDFISMRTRERALDDQEVLPGGNDFAQLPTFGFDTFEAEAQWLIERLEATGTERVIVADLTLEGLQIPVVRVTIPGLRHPVPARTSSARRDVNSLSRTGTS